MKTTVNEYDFIEAFKSAGRENQFSRRLLRRYWALRRDIKIARKECGRITPWIANARLDLDFMAQVLQGDYGIIVKRPFPKA